jgi:hypothetical protein
MAKIVDLARTLAGHDRELESDLIADLIMEADLTGPELDAIQQRLQRNAHAARQRARRQRRTPNMSSLNTLGDEDDHDSPVEAISHDSPDRDAMLHELETEIFSIPSTPFEREYLAVLFGQNLAARTRSEFVKATAPSSKSSAYRQTGRVDSEIRRILEAH